MKHLSDEQLVLHYYGEAEARPEVEQHLAQCDACRQRDDALQQVFAAVEAAPVPERGEAYGREVWLRLRPRLEEARGFRWADFFQPRRLAWAGGVAVLLVAAFLGGRFWPRPEMVAQPIPPQVRERILLVAVGDHLERSEMVLVELVHAQGNGTVDITTEQQWAGELVAANRLYRQAAAREGEVGVTSVLEELERMLLEIAHSPSQLTSKEFERLRRRVEAEGILFKVRVIGSQVREREKAAAPAAERRVS